MCNNVYVVKVGIFFPTAANNAVSLSKQGCLSALSKLLTGVGQKNLVILKYVYMVLDIRIWVYKM